MAHKKEMKMKRFFISIHAKRNTHELAEGGSAMCKAFATLV